ncbi:MAG: hypothetical protein P0Y60_15800 [Candidatus Microbacterium colombiense]|nr:MAG: hypothetical protein P0Y60_15800 [Microbacterium sp.]
MSETEWVIHDLHFADGDHRRAVCCISTVTDTEVEVLWMRDLPLPLRHASAYDVLHEVERFQEARRATRPIPIPRLPPPAH